MPGPLQYGPGIKAYAVHLLVAQMLSLKRTAQSMHALIGRLLSEATLLGYIAQLHQALAEWEHQAIERLLAQPAMHVDETSLRVDRKNHWIHVYSAGTLTVKRLHPKRGCEAIEAIGIIPRYGGVAVHDSMRQAQLDRRATIQGPIRRQQSNAQVAGNALFGNIGSYYRGQKGSAERIRDTLAEGARIGAFTEVAPYSPPEYKSYNPMNEPTFQVANFMVPLAHAYLILKEEYPQDAELLSSVKGWGDRLFEVTKNSRDDFKGRAKGIDRRALIAAGWAHWGSAADNRDAVAQAKRYYKRAMQTFARGGKDRIWKYKGKRRIYYVNMTVAAVLATAYALHRAGVDDAYTMAPKRGTIVEGAEWLWEKLVEGRHSDLLRTRHPGSRSVAWIELFIREFPDHPSTAKMRAWRSKATSPLSGNMGGGPTTCLYRRIP